MADEGNCEFTINADHYIIDEAYCEWTPQANLALNQQFFTRLTIGEGLWVNQGDGGDCDWRISADHHIKGTDYCDHVQAVDEFVFFNRLNFDRGLQVTDDGQCAYTIKADHYVKDEAYCDHTPAANVANNVFFNKLWAGTGLKLELVEDCTYRINADHKLTDTDPCKGTVPDISNKFFNHLVFNSGLTVELVDGFDCKYYINADIKVLDSDYCDWEATVTEKLAFECLTFGTGLQVYDEGACEYRIEADHYITDSGSCGVTATVTNQFFNHLVAGSGLQVVSSGDCIYRIDADHKIKGSDYCEYEQEVPEFQFFNGLNFDRGLQVTDDANCKYTIKADHFITDSGSCGVTPTVTNQFFNKLVAGSGLKVVSTGDGCGYSLHADHEIKDTSTCGRASVVAGYKFFNKLNFNSGLYLADNGNCEYSLQADHYISSTGSSCADTEDGIGKEFFSHLSFGQNLGVKSVGDCKYEIWSCPTQVKDSPYCDWSPSIATSCTDVECVNFGTGLQIVSLAGGEAVVNADHEIKGTTYCDHTTTVPNSVFFNKLIFDSGLQVIKGDDCDFTIYGDHYVKDEAYCDHTPAANVANNVFFNKLWAGTGLQLESVGDCTYRINADHEIKGTTYCAFPTTVPNYKFFNKINFDEGLYVTKDDGECEYTIKADHRITDVSYCDWTRNVNNEFFSHLHFGNGLYVLDNGDCEYTIHADHYVYDSGYCDYIPSDPTEGEGRFFDALIFGSGLKVLESGNGACNYRIDADHYISSTGTTCAETESINNKFFTHLSFTSGIGVKAVEDTVGDCKYEIWACPVQVQDSGYCDWVPSVATSCTDVECIVFGTGLKVTSLVGGDIVVGADHHISSTASTALGGSSGIKPTETDIDREFFSHLTFTDLMGVKDLGDCKYEVWSQGVEAMDLSCYESSTYCNNKNLQTISRPYQSPSMTGLVGGRGLGLYYITGATAEQGMHYIESTLSISSGSVHTDCGQAASTTYVSSLEFIDLGRGLEGVPQHSCGAESDCDMTIKVNRYITDSGRCNPIPATTVSNQFFNELIFNSGLRVNDEGHCNYSIDADHYISSTGANAIGTETDINREFFTHISFGDMMGVKDLGDCKYEVWSQCLEGVDISCTAAKADYCGNLNLGTELGEVLCVTGLVVGPGLDFYKITGDVGYQGMHYLETNLRISSGCSTTEYVKGLETITLGCGLSGTPGDTCTDNMTGDTVGVCDMTISLNPLACKGGITDVRYVDDICCTGGGLEIIYKHLRFSSCGLFTGVTGTDSC